MTLNTTEITAAPFRSAFFTVDVEEYFHVNAFEKVISRDDWPRWPSRLERSVGELLELLDRRGARGTFFVLGWVADHHPEVVRRISAAGHEIASHGYWHRRIPTLSAEQFGDDLQRSKDALENLTGIPVQGFRAPSFSIIPGFEWAFDVLIDRGFTYDSSLFPIHRPGYGYATAPVAPHVISRSAGQLMEFPLATTTIAGIRLPAAGGGYLRHFPLAVVRRALAQNKANGIPSTFYIHPWEIDGDQPRVHTTLLTRIRHYRGLKTTKQRLERLLSEFRFTAIREYIDGLESDSMTSAR